MIACAAARPPPPAITPPPSASPAATVAPATPSAPEQPSPPVASAADGATRQVRRTRFAICVHAERRGAQEEICRGILGTLRAGREAARNASAPGVATVAETT